MWIIISLTMSHLLTQNCQGLNLIDLPSSESDISPAELIERRDFKNSKPFKSTPLPATRHWLFRQSDQIKDAALGHYEDEKDLNIKQKITTLVQQTLHDTERKIKSIQHLKEANREAPPYRVGFVLSMVKKARDILNELFNVAVKHRDSWKALEQLKIFELIVHTNVDTTNLVRQLVEIHIQHLNATSPAARSNKRRVVLLK